MGDVLLVGVHSDGKLTEYVIHCIVCYYAFLFYNHK